MPPKLHPQPHQSGHLTITRPRTVHFTSSSLAFHHPRYSPCQDLYMYFLMLFYFHQALNFLSSALPVHRPFVYSVDTSTAISPHTLLHTLTTHQSQVVRVYLGLAQFMSPLPLRLTTHTCLTTLTYIPHPVLPKQLFLDSLTLTMKVL